MAIPTFANAMPYVPNDTVYSDFMHDLGPGDQSNQANAYVSNYYQTFQNLVGRPPSAQEIYGFIRDAGISTAKLPGDASYSDLTNLSNNYVQTAFGPQVAQYQQQQQTDQLGKTQQTIQDLIGKQTQALAGQLTDPTSSTYQQFSGMMNNMGITPSSGAFQAGVGGALGQNAANAENAALGSVSLPAIGGIQSMNQNPYSFAQQNSNLGHLNQLGDFGLQEQLAEFLSQQGQPSSAQNILGMASGASQGAGSLLQGGSAAYKATSYICKELIKHDLLCESDMDDFHVHIMPAMFKKGRAFWKYAMDGLNLVNAVNRKGLDWKVFKPLLFDRVMEEPDPCKAVDLYSDACQQLCISCERSLWDQRVYRTSLWDSLKFLPLLLSYPPFLEALAKCVRIKTLVIYDKPKCQRHFS